jgi:hypothetical protein
MGIMPLFALPRSPRHPPSWPPCHTNSTPLNLRDPATRYRDTFAPRGHGTGLVPTSAGSTLQFSFCKACRRAAYHLGIEAKSHIPITPFLRTWPGRSQSFWKTGWKAQIGGEKSAWLTKSPTSLTTALVFSAFTRSKRTVYENTASQTRSGRTTFATIQL